MKNPFKLTRFHTSDPNLNFFYLTESVRDLRGEVFHRGEDIHPGAHGQHQGGAAAHH